MGTIALLRAERGCKGFYSFVCRLLFVMDSMQLHAHVYIYRRASKREEDRRREMEEQGRFLHYVTF